MGKKISLLFLIAFLFFPSLTFAQQQKPNQRYVKATVLEVLEEGKKDIAGQQNFIQKLKVRITDDPEKNKELTVEHGGIFNITPLQLLRSGDQVILVKTENPNGTVIYSIMDKYRLNNVIYMLIGFFLLVLLVSGKKGFGSLLGMVVSLAIILTFIVPQILGGKDPLLISIIGSITIMMVSIYLAHGFSKTTNIAVGSTAIALTLTGLLAVLFVRLASLTGLGSEDTYLLQFGPSAINLQGLLLGSMIIGALGVLDDTTTTQSATIAELARTDKTLSAKELAEKGLAIGHEHIASLVNTLVLAYAGASLGIFILFVMNPAHQPYWVILNSEVIVEEVIRTLAGSIGLILAVPITTIIASYFARNKVK